MKLVKVSRNGRNAEGVVEGEQVRIIGGWRDGAAIDAPFLLAEDFDAIRDRVSQARETVDLKDVVLELPIGGNRKIICSGLNYKDHVDEGALEPTAVPSCFHKDVGALSPHGQPILLPRASETHDFEGEIAVMIGRTCRHVTAEEGQAAVGGYTCLMDGSVREYQNHSVAAGKNFWRSGAMGPWIVTSDEVPDPNALTIETYIDGVRVQSSSADLMLFSIGAIVSYCSKWTQLNPGDVISTGTPAGVGAVQTPPRWLRAGEVVEVRVNKVGALTNTVVAER